MTRPGNLIATALLFVSALLLPGLAHAQIFSVYGTLSIPHVSNVQTGAVYNGTTYTNQTTSLTPAGIGGGVTLNFLPLPVVKVGLDLRGSTKPGTVGADTALGGLRVGFTPPLLKLHPYIQGSVGYLATRTTNVSTVSGSTTQTVGGTFNNKYAVYEVIGGVDYPLIHFVDLRLVEIGVGHSLLDGSSQGVSIFTVNTGVVVHF